MWTKITSDEKTLPPLGVPVVVERRNGGGAIAERFIYDGEWYWAYVDRMTRNVHAENFHSEETEWDDVDPVAWHPLPEPYVEEKPE